nr:hypothetical protein [Anaerotruncus colihominis]
MRQDKIGLWKTLCQFDSQFHTNVIFQMMTIGKTVNNNCSALQQRQIVADKRGISPLNIRNARMQFYKQRHPASGTVFEKSQWRIIPYIQYSRYAKLIGMFLKKRKILFKKLFFLCAV